MSLNTTVGSPDLNSYGTVAEANAFFLARKGMDVSDWNDVMTEADKEYCLKNAMLILDGLFRFRGQKAVAGQLSAWPRLFPGDALFTDGYGDDISYKTWEDLVQFAALINAPLPTIPERVKSAQFEIAFQVVHKYQGTLEAFEAEGGPDISSVGIGGEINLSFSQPSPSAVVDVIDKAEVSALSPVRFFLKPYLAGIRGGYL